MPREYPRSRRLADQMQRVLNEIIREELQDPRLEFVTVSAVEVSGDLRQARAWVSILPPDADSPRRSVSRPGERLRPPPFWRRWRSWG